MSVQKETLPNPRNTTAGWKNSFAYEKLIELEEKGEVFVIRPSEPIGIGRLEKDPQKLQSVYELGFNDAKKNIEKLKKYLEK